MRRNLNITFEKNRNETQAGSSTNFTRGDKDARRRHRIDRIRERSNQRRAEKKKTLRVNKCFRTQYYLLYNTTDFTTFTTFIASRLYRVFFFFLYWVTFGVGQRDYNNIIITSSSVAAQRRDGSRAENRFRNIIIICIVAAVNNSRCI